jgi:serine/threonine protein phosphatase PrpC
MRLDGKFKSPIGDAVYAELESPTTSEPQSLSFANETAAIGTVRGSSRSKNDDRAAVVRIAGRTGRHVIACLVCDGVGSTPRGGQAASVAIASFIEALVQRTHISGHTLEELVRYADTEVRRLVAGAGATTIVGVVVGLASAPLVVGVGDSRVHSWDGTSMAQLTTDDTIENELRRQNIPDQSAIGARRMRGSLVQCLGETGREADELVVAVTSHAEATGFLLGSDGLWRIGEATFQALVTNAPSASEAVRRVLLGASWTGGVDDATAIAIADIRGLDESLASSVPATYGRIDMWTAAGRFSSATTTPSAPSEVSIRPDPLPKRAPAKAKQKRGQRRRDEPLAVERFPSPLALGDGDEQDSATQ